MSEFRSPQNIVFVFHRSNIFFLLISGKRHRPTVNFSNLEQLDGQEINPKNKKVFLQSLHLLLLHLLSIFIPCAMIVTFIILSIYNTEELGFYLVK